MQFRNILCSAAATLGLIAAQPAWAQTSDSASIDASAVLVEGVSTLSIAAERSLSFGQVAIPNGGLPGHTCFFSVGGTGDIEVPDDSIVTSEELGPDARIFAQGSVTPSGCSSDATGRYGLFRIQCVPGTIVSFQSSIGIVNLPGVFFGPDAAAFSLSGREGNDFPGFNVPGTATLPCPAQSTAFATPGEIRLNVVGSLRIAANAQPGPANVGSVTMNVSY